MSVGAGREEELVVRREQMTRLDAACRCACSPRRLGEAEGLREAAGQSGRTPGPAEHERSSAEAVRRRGRVVVRGRACDATYLSSRELRAKHSTSSQKCFLRPPPIRFTREARRSSFPHRRTRQPSSTCHVHDV